MPTYTATGITLIARSFRGSERMVTFFTRERGKVEAVAKGVGKPGSSLAAAVEPLTLSRLFLAEGRTVDHLTQCEVLDSFYGLRTDMQRLAYGSYVAELTARTTEPADPHPALFDLLHATLAEMENAADPQKLAFAYALHLLAAVGVAPALEACVNCGRETPQRAAYNAVHGGLVCAECETPGVEAIPLSAAVRGALVALATLPVERIGRLQLPESARRQIAGLLRRHIEYHLGLQLKSEEFLAKLGAERRHVEGGT